MLQANITDINALHILYNKTYIKLRQADHTCYYQWYVTPRHAVKAYGRMEVQLHSFLFSVLNGEKWSTLHLGRFTPEARAHITHRTVMTRFDCCHVVYLQKQGVAY
jgi:hypothetical protein